MLVGRRVPSTFIRRFAAQFPELTAEDQNQRLESGALKWEKDVQFARQRLLNTHEIDSPMRGVWRITEAGRERLNDNVRRPSPRVREAVQSPLRVSSPVSQTAEEGEAPEVAIDMAYQRVRSALVSQLLDRIRGSSPSFFERLVVDLLVKMGYGGTSKDAGQALGRVGDGGVDGVIKQDRLGLDRVYVQAKRWENTPVGDRKYRSSLARFKVTRRRREFLLRHHRSQGTRMISCRRSTRR
jgi:restriction system protein